MLFGGNTKGIKFNQKGLLPVIVQDEETQKVLIYVYMNKEAIKRTRKTHDLWLFHRKMKKVWKKGGHSGNTMKVVDMKLHHDRNVLLVKVIANGPGCHTGNETCFMESFLNESTKLQEVEPLKNDETDGLGALPQLFDSQDLSNDVEFVSAPNENLPVKTEQSLSIEFQDDETKNDPTIQDTLGDIFSSIKNKISLKQESSFTAKMAGLGSEKIAQKIGENAMHLMGSVTRKDQSDIVKKEAEMVHNMLILLAEQKLEIEQLKNELTKRIT
jgi:phosphoribosyl-AMP cyclohydrolase / phosphoribosyl-ATP pyrophosphohydrolase